MIAVARKRSNGNGYVRRLKSGSWSAQLMDGYREDGKKNIICFTAPTKSEVNAMIRKYWYSKETGEYHPKRGSGTPFSQWADIWYSDYESQVQPSTYSNYQYTLKALKEHFGKKPIEEIKPMDINGFYNYLQEASFSKSYLSKCRAMLIQIFDYAEANEKIRSNPARKSKAIRIIPPFDPEEMDEAKKDAFSAEELTLLKEYLPDTMTGHTIRFMLGTGLRSQEVLALTPQDIAPDGSCVTINKAVKTVGGAPSLGPPKSKKGKRVIPIPDDYRADALFLVAHSGEPFIWTSNRENSLFDIGTFRRRYYREIKKIPGVRPLSPHCCRHTYVSCLERMGVPMEQIARLAGHSQITTTDSYLHMDLSTLSSAVAVLNEPCI